MAPKRSKQSLFPASRIKRIIQADEEVGKVGQATPLVVSKAVELFIADLTKSAVEAAEQSGSKKLSTHHVKRVVETKMNFDFLRDIVKDISEPVEGEKVKRKRKPKEENGEGTPAPEKKAKKPKKEKPEQADTKPAVADTKPAVAETKPAAVQPAQPAAVEPPAPAPTPAPIAPPVAPITAAQDDDYD